MAGFSTLEISKRALAAQQLGLDVTSNNIANVNTPGYSRRQAGLTQTDPAMNQSCFMGTGLIVDNMRTFREEFFDQQVRKSISTDSGYEIDQKIYSQIESILGEPSENGLSESVTKFFTALQDVSSNPESIASRTNLIETSKSLVEKFHQISSQIDETKTEIVTNVNQNLLQINRSLKDVADLNLKIASSKAQTGQDAQTFIDQREQILEDLSKLAGVTVTQGNLSSVNVYINGISMVTGPVASTLQLKENVNAGTGEKTLQVMKIDENGNPSNYVNMLSGETASLMKHFNTTLNAQDTDNFSVTKNINDLANALVTKVNSLTVGGYGFDDTGATPPGRSFFTPTVGNVTAASIDINPDITNNPRNIPLSDTPGEQGNGVIGVKLAGLADDTSFVNGMKPVEFYQNFISKLASYGNDAQNGKSASNLITQQLTNQRESVIGVNIDEEAINLIKFQRAFEASSRVVNITNQLLSTIINLGS